MFTTRSYLSTFLIERKTKFGFVYIWYDTVTKKFYLGSHFFGKRPTYYICGSRWMRRAFRKRPKTFKRKILYWLNVNDRAVLLKEEQRWLDMIKDHELGEKYYNFKKRANGGRAGGWKMSEQQKRQLSEKRKGSVVSETVKEAARKRMKGKQYSLGIIVINKNGVDKNIRHHELDSHLSLGWVRGSCRNYHQENQRKATDSIRGTRIYTNGIDQIRIKNGDDIPMGYVRGKLKKHKEETEAIHYQRRH